MAKIKDCVVITAELLVEATNKLKELGYNDLAKKLIANHQPLKPIITDCWNQKNITLYSYLTKTEI